MKTETKPKPKLPKIPAAPETRAPALAVEAWPVDRPKPYAKNPRRNDAAVEKVAASIREFGWAQPIVVDGDGVIIIGHTRLKAAKKLGLKTVPVLVRADLTPEQVAALRLADNKTAELAEWDEPLLAAELDALVGAVDMEQFGFDLSAPTGTEGQTDEDAVPDAPPEPVSRRGAVYALGRHRLMCGDSTDADAVAKLMNGERADLCFTDPPYGVSYTGGIQFKSDGSVEQNNRQMIANDDIDIYAKVLEVLKDVVNGPCYIWFADKNAASLYTAAEKYGEIHAQIIWVKNGGYGALNANYKQKHEPCLYWKPKGATLNFIGATTETTIWEINKDGKNEYHPTQKPVALSGKAISNHKADIILDLFGGSGSTMIACEQLGRKCRMMELDPHYCDVIRKRWAEFVHGEGCDWQTLAPEVDA